MTRIFTLILAILCILSAGSVFAQSIEIQSGDIIEDTLADDKLIAEYTFSANEGDQITVRLSSRQFDASLYILNADGKVFASNDDFEGSLNAAIEDFDIPKDDDYIIVATSSDETGTGDYELSFNMSALNIIEYGDMVEGNLVTHEKDIYQFEGNEGDVISIRMYSETVDSIVTLANQEYEITSDDNGAGGINALIPAFTLESTGTYLISASSYYDIVGDGDYSLYLDLIDTTPIEVNEPFTDTIADEPLYYTFEVSMGDRISVNVTGKEPTLDTSLTLKTQYSWYGSDDDSGYRYNPELNDVIINNDSVLTLVVVPMSPYTEGEFELVVIREPATMLECDSTHTMRFNTRIYQVPFQMNVKGRQPIEFTFSTENGNVLDFYTYILLNNEYIPEDDRTTSDGELSIEITPPFTGLLSLITSNYTPRPTTFQMTVSCS